MVLSACTKNVRLDASAKRTSFGLLSKVKERINMVKRHILALLGAFAISVPAFAADTGGYLVGMVGQTKAKDIDTTGLTNVSVDDTDTGIKLGGGYPVPR